MMKWYSKYLTIFEKPFGLVPKPLLQQIKNNMEHFQAKDPLATVVVIAHNEEKRLLSCIWSLSENICDFPVEIIGINNNSTDKTAEVFDAVGVKWYFEEKKSPGHARSRGLANAKGKYYFSIDADTIYPPTYLQTMMNELKKPGMVAVSSIYSFAPDPKISAFKLKIYEFLRDIHLKALSYRSPELSARGSAFAYITDYGRKVGYRVNIKAGEDGALALGLKKYGKIKLILKRKARVITCANPLSREGSLWKNFNKKFKKELKHLKRYFFRKETYADTENNLIPSSSKPSV